MTRAVRVDVLDRVLHGVDDADGEDHGQELGVPVLRGDVEQGVGQLGAGGGLDAPVGAQLDARLAQRLQRPGRSRRRVAVDEQRLGGVAHAGALGLGVDDDRLGLLDVRPRRLRTRGSCDAA